MSKQEELLNRYEKLIRKAKQSVSKDEADKAPGSCRRCPYYRPEFRYRFCLYARCPFKKADTVFRKKPKAKDPFSEKRW